jgi:cation transport ATPase
MNGFSFLFLLIGLGLSSGIYFQTIFSFDQKLIVAICSLSLISITIWLRIATIILYFGLSRLSVHGVYFSVLGLIQKAANLDYLFCEKTGTLTRGRFHYSQYALENGVNQGDFLSAIFSLEKESRHPLAKAMESHPWYVEIPVYPVRKIKEHIGLGICGEVCLPDGKPKFIAVGNTRFLKRNQMYISKQIREKIEELEAMGETVILCGWDRQTKGVLGFSDNLRVDVQSFLDKVKKLKMKSIMITGDHDEMVGNLAYTKQLENIYTRCLPEEKANKIKNRQNKSKTVGLLGYKKAIGPAFDQADVSILFGLTKIPEKDNSILILGRKLLKVTDILLFSRQIWSSYKAHFRFGFIFSLIGIGLISFNLINPLFAFLILFILHAWVLIYPLSLTETSFDG